jgi:hypothetical protein
MWRKWSILIKCSMPYALHDSFASEVLSWPMVRPYWYNLASYVARGGVRCGFIPSEVWRQRTYALHSHAFIEVIFADIVDEGKCYTNYCGCSRKWDGIGYIGTIEFYIYKYSDLNCDSYKMLINSSCGLNISSKQFTCSDVSSHSCITQCRCLMLIKGSGK